MSDWQIEANFGENLNNIKDNIKNLEERLDKL